jgi:hypothetical protein
MIPLLVSLTALALGSGSEGLAPPLFGDGKLRIYKNRGTAKEPRFEGFTWFKTGEQFGSIPSG